MPVELQGYGGARSDGVVLHVILMGSIQLFVRGMIDSAALVWIQLANAVLFLLIPWLAEKWRDGALVSPVIVGSQSKH